MIKTVGYPCHQCRDVANKTLTLIHTNQPLLSTHPADTLRLLYNINSMNNRYDVIGSCHTCGVIHDTAVMDFQTQILASLLDPVMFAGLYNQSPLLTMVLGTFISYDKVVNKRKNVDKKVANLKTKTCSLAIA